MPPRKEPKETVVYPASKRKPPPFKPQRPSKVPRISTTESESSIPKRAAKSTTPARRKPAIHDDEDEDSHDEERHSSAGAQNDSDSSEDLAADPLASKPKRPSNAAKPPVSKRKSPREPSLMSVSSENASETLPERSSAAPDPPPIPSQSDVIPSIPQPLLIRLLHEHFADEKTKIDKHAVQVLQKYFEVFIRETVERAKLQKKENVGEEGGMSDVDLGWLERDDLERVAGGMMLDF